MIYSIVLPRSLLVDSLFAFVHGTGTHGGFKCIVFELCHGTLGDLLHCSRGLTPLPSRHVLEIAYQIVSAIDCKCAVLVSSTLHLEKLTSACKIYIPCISYTPI